MKLRNTILGFTLIELLVVLVFFPILMGASGYLFITSLRAFNSGIDHAGIRDDVTFAMKKIVRDLKDTEAGGLSQYSSIAHTLEIDTTDGENYAYYLYNADDSTLDSTYGEDTYDLRRADLAGGWTEFTNDDFETDWGNWTDGGADAARYTGGTYAHGGSAAIDLQDNTSTSVMSTGDLEFSTYNQVKVDFWFYAFGFSTGHDFWLQISTNGGTDYTTDTTWVADTDFTNGSFYEESVTLTGYTLTDTTRIRFRADAANNGNDVYIDDVVVSASTGSPEDPASGEGMLLLRDVVSPDATEPATDITYSGNEITLDLVVQRGTNTVTTRTKVRPRNL